MRISNGIRRIEDGSIKAITMVKPNASWIVRKTAMAAFCICVVPIGVVANMTIAAVDTLHLGTEASICAIREV
jgi:hypothetical protein